jgi:hypothetical protein
MGRIYLIVETALRGYSPPELQALGEGREELIAQFIFSKILRLDAKPEAVESTDEGPDNGHSAPSSSFALCAYFRRYLIDCTRASSFRRRVSMGDDALENQAEERHEHEDDLLQILAEHGLSLERVATAARALIDNLGAPERILLCECLGKETAGGLSGVAARYAIASYHYRAGRLGLVHRRESLPADYSKTTLGAWMQNTLGIAIEAENMSVILSIFKILGVEASYG